MNKERLIILVGLVGALFSEIYAQPAVKYSYDATGNRIQRKITVIPPSNSNRVAGNTPAKPSENYTIGVFPNPVQDHLTVNISGSAASCALVLSDESGRVLLSLQNQALNSEVDMRPYQPGVYYLSVTPSGGKVAVYKILKGG